MMRNTLIMPVVFFTILAASCAFPNGGNAGNPADSSLSEPSPPAMDTIGNLPGGSSAPFLQVFEHADYGGASLLFSDLQAVSLSDYTLRKKFFFKVITWNDQISSIRLTNGSIAILCEHSNLGGRWELITENVSNLKTRGFNDLTTTMVVSSVQNFTNDGPTAVVFDKAGYAGYWDEIDIGENKPVLPLPGYTPNYYPNMDRSISSVRCYSGARLKIYNSQHYRGYYVSTADSISNLADYMYDNLTRSISVERDVYPSGSTPFYRYYNTNEKDHFNTANWYELEWGNGSWEYKGIDCYVFLSQYSGTIPLYEYWYSGNGTCDHLLVTDKNMAAGSAWRYSGIRGYIFQNQTSGTVPLYGYWNASACDHAVTTNVNVYKSADGWAVFGILGYVYPSTHTGFVF